MLGFEGGSPTGVSPGWDVQRQHHGHGQDGGGSDQRPGHRDMVQVDQQHLAADQYQHDRQA